MYQWLVAEKNSTLVRFIRESNQSKESGLIERGRKRRQKATSFLSKKFYFFSVEFRICGNTNAASQLNHPLYWQFKLSLSIKIHICFSMKSRVCLLEGHYFLQPLPMSPNLNRMWWLCWPAVTPLAATAPVLLPPTTRITIMYKNEVRFGISSLRIARPIIVCVCNCNRISWAFKPF